MENFFDFLQNINFPSFAVPQIGLNSVLDILVIAFIIYQVLMWIKQTRAWILFKGIVVILMISGLALVFELHTVTFILSKTLSVGLTAVIIIFQPELRKALEKLGKGKMFSVFSSLEGDSAASISKKTIDELIGACVKMSKARTGALIALEQQVPLGDLEATGIPVDAVVSSQLLINIFENKTPLHDGAVLIRQNRVSAATCILPLTQDALSSELGTRHRAAVGASEVSDAYVVVVSEETGNISIAKDGKLYRNMTADEMREMLSDEKKPIRPHSGVWKGLRRHE